MVPDDKALQWVYAACDAVNATLAEEDRIVKSADTVLHGSGAAVDSLTIINLMLEVENVVEQNTGKRLSLMNTDAAADGSFATVGKLAEHVSKQLASA